MDVPRCMNEGMYVQMMDSDHFPVLLFLLLLFHFPVLLEELADTWHVTNRSLVENKSATYINKQICINPFCFSLD